MNSGEKPPILSKNPDLVKPSGWSVGAKQNSDGSWDYSRAMSVPEGSTLAKNLDNATERQKEERGKKLVPQSAKSLTKEKRAEQVKNEQEIREARLMLDVITEGSVGISVSLPPGLSPNGSAGFNQIKDSRWNNALSGKYSFREVSGFFELGERDLYHTFSQEQIREFIGLVPAVQDVESEIDVPIQQKRFGGLLGSKIVMEKKKQKTGEKPILHSEAVTGGRNEPLFKLRYAARDTQADHSDPLLTYTDDGGRPGNLLLMEILLPQSVAEKLMQEIERNPSFIRKIAGELIVKKIGLPEKAWREGQDKDTPISIRPPYENWDAKSGGKFYIKLAEDGTGFKPERVLMIKS